MANLNLFFTACFFIFGSIFGSFISVLIYRIHSKEKGIVFGRSFCPHCKVQLKSYDMIPLLSYIFLKGRCRSCNAKISIHYFLLELLTAIIFSLTFLHFNFLETQELTLSIFMLVIYSLSISLSFYDIKYLSVPLQLSIPFIVLAGLGSYFILGLPIQSIIIGGIIGKGFFWIQHKISKGKWVGIGDSDLGLGIGLFLGWKMLLVSLLLSYILASIISIALLISKKATPKSKIAFGPFLLLAFYITTLYGQEILNWYLHLDLLQLF